MPIIIKNPNLNKFFIENQKKSVEEEKITPEVKKEPTLHNHILIVNGKEKIISRSSAYILDMLTIDKHHTYK